jgi:hypothetical protein
MKEVYPMEPREEEKREPEAPEVRPEPPRLKRFRIVKLEERIAPQASAYLRDRPNSTTIDPYIC